MKLLCSNNETFWNILKLNQRFEGEPKFTWDMVFSDDIRVTMYNLDII